MSRRLHRAVNRWLRIERESRNGSERALRRVFAALPAPLLPVGFADRVMLAAGLVAPRPAVPRGWRVALGGALAAAAVAAATVPTVVLGLSRQISAGDLLRFAAGAVVETCQRLAEGLAVWRTIASVGEIFTETLSAPPMLMTMLAATLLSAGGLRMLHGLLAGDRRRENA